MGACMQEATVHIVEGEKEDKCYHHPEGKWSRQAFFILHNQNYAMMHLIVTFVLMLLVVPETESEKSLFKELKLTVKIHSVMLINACI